MVLNDSTTALTHMFDERKAISFAVLFQFIRFKSTLSLKEKTVCLYNNYAQLIFGMFIDI